MKTKKEKQTATTPSTEQRTYKETVTAILKNVHPDTDFSDDETLFAQIYCDYAAYASMIEDSQQAEAAAEAHVQELAKARATSAIEIGRLKDGTNDAEIDKAYTVLKEIAEQGVKGQYSPTHVILIAKGHAYDDAVKKARDEGEIAGRNTRIEQLLTTRATGDGLPVLGGSNAPYKAHRPRSIFDAARDAK